MLEPARKVVHGSWKVVHVHNLSRLDAAQVPESQEGRNYFADVRMKTDMNRGVSYPSGHLYPKV